MAKKKNHHNGCRKPIDFKIDREAALLDAPKWEWKQLQTGESVVRILLVCRTRREREICGLRHYHELSVADVALRLDLLPGQVKDVLGDVHARCRLIDQRNERMHRLREKLGTGKRQIESAFKHKNSSDKEEEG